MEWKNIFAVFALLLLFAGCIGGEDMVGKSTGSGTSAIHYPGAPTPSYAEMDYDASYYGGESRMVIQTGSLALKVQEGTLEEKVAAARGFVSDVRGTYSSLSYYESDTQKTYYLTVKVPPAKFDEFVSKLKGIGEIKSMDTSLEDVTEQYTDLNARISNLEAELSRLNALYERAENVEDVLLIEREVTRVQTNLDIYNQQKLDLERRSSMSTIQVRIYEEKPAIQTGLFLPLEQLLAIFFGAFSFAIMLLVGVLGFLLPPLIVVWAIWRLWKALKK